MSTRINRITLFRLPEPEAQKKLVEAYGEVAKTQSKVCPFPPSPPGSDSDRTGSPTSST